MKTLTTVLVVLLLASCEVISVDPPGFDPRNEITGTYQVEEFSETYNSTSQYSIVISKGEPHQDIYLKNMYNTGKTVKAQLMCGKVYITWQVQDEYRFQGIGTVNGNRLTLNYRVSQDIGETDFCTSEAWPQ